MNLFKLFLLFVFILYINNITLKIDYYKFFKKINPLDIYFLNTILSFILGYLLYKVVMEIFNLSTSLI